MSNSLLDYTVVDSAPKLFPVVDINIIHTLSYSEMFFLVVAHVAIYVYSYVAMFSL